MRKILFLLFIFFVVYIIGFKVNYNDNVDFYVGKKVGKYYFIKKEVRIEDLKHSIRDNINIYDKKIQTILVKSNNVYIDLNYFILNKNSFKNSEELFDILRYYNKENIVVKLRKENTIMDKKFNIWILSLKDKYDIIIMR